jgi:hypothetical protein
LVAQRNRLTASIVAGNRQENPMRLVRGSITIAAMLLLLTACRAGQPGSETPPAGTDNGVALLPVADLADRAAAAIDTNSSVHIKGYSTGGSAPVAIEIQKQDLVVGTCAVTMEGLQAEAMRVGGSDYVRADAQFWLTKGPEGLNNAAAAERLAGRWAKDNLFSAELGPVTKYLDFPQFVWEVLRESPLTKGERATVNGTPAITVVDDHQNRIFIATVGEPYVLRFEFPGALIFDFSGYREPVRIEAPAAADVVDIETLT